MERRFEIKICGMRLEDDIKKADELGVEYVGFVFYPKSPRFVNPIHLVGLLSHLAVSCRKIGVFVNEKRDYVEKIVSDMGLYAVQLHGDEHPSDFAEFPVPLWRAVRQNVHNIEKESAKWNVERYVLDTGTHEKYGGTGIMGDMNEAAKFAGKHKIMLAGGLNSRNVKEVLRNIFPFGVDVASGVEIEPGRKNHEEMKKFVEAVRSIVNESNL